MSGGQDVDRTLLLFSSLPPWEYCVVLKNEVFMNRRKPLSLAFCSVLWMAFSAHAQTFTSAYGSMAAVGTFNGWQMTPNLMLVTNHIWQRDFRIP
jgi:hypothetical protein